MPDPREPSRRTDFEPDSRIESGENSHDERPFHEPAAGRARLSERAAVASPESVRAPSQPRSGSGVQSAEQGSANALPEPASQKVVGRGVLTAPSGGDGDRRANGRLRTASPTPSAKRTPALDSVLPLPAEEGRGEGESTTSPTEWILTQRAARNPVDPERPYAYLIERENFGQNHVADVATIFLTNRECPWRCLMCDLWKNTLTESVQPAAIPRQIDYALNALGCSNRASVLDCGGPPPPFGGVAQTSPHARAPEGWCTPRPGGETIAGLKLYNSGSFFDPRAIPEEDYPAIAECASNFQRLIVECHPSLIGDRVLRFRDMLTDGRARHSVRAADGGYPDLEIAMGLETAHPQVLERLNKRMTLDDFARAAEFLRANQIALRAFVLVKPPFIIDEAEALHWAQRSVDFAFECGASVVSLIPTRLGNGALEALAAEGKFAMPKLATLEAALDYGIGLKRGRVFADLWDLGKFSDCPACFAQRRARLNEMNLRQCNLLQVQCSKCRQRHHNQ